MSDRPFVAANAAAMKRGAQRLEEISREHGAIFEDLAVAAEGNRWGNGEPGHLFAHGGKGNNASCAGMENCSAHSKSTNGFLTGARGLAVVWENTAGATSCRRPVW
ncbi:hypothetical protein AB4305_16590 [Nocardia sp. 2YAB30]|uniref:hypothetical protein n=1 Tax=unclassified Nocardia TaxID=2637762 RepID=UPI003F9DE890